MKTRLMMKRFHNYTLLSVSTICLLSFNVEATSTPDIPQRGPIPFATYDQDNNGSISEEEFYATRHKRIQAKAESGSPMRGLANAPQFRDFDSNNDGEISPDELSAGQANQKMPQMNNQRRNMPSFSDLDQNNDGSISRTEMNTFHSERINERTEGGYPMKNMGKMHSFDNLDLNHDGMIDPSEFHQHQMMQKP